MTDVHAAAGSYAVDALSPGERLEFEAHLVGCASCQQEVAEFADTLAELSPLSAATPPSSLRSAVLAAVSGGQVAGRRLAPTNGHANGHASNGGSEAAPRRALPAQVTELRPLGPDEVAPLEEHPSVLPEQPWLDVAAALSDDGGGGRRERRRDWLLGAVVAAALVVALVLSGWVYVSWEQSQRRVVQQQRETALLTAPDATVYHPTGSAEGIRVSFVVSQGSDEALFLGDDLRDPGRDRVYQLWTIKGGRPVSAGLVREGGDVRQWVTLSGDITGFALSSEPGPRGSETPTDKLAEVRLSTP